MLLGHFMVAASIMSIINYSIRPIIISFILNLIATKRLFIVETAWIVIILLYYLPRIRGRAKNVVPFIIFIVIITGALYYYSGTSSINMSELAESQTSRFEEEDIEATGFVRFRESGHAFAISSPFLSIACARDVD